MDMRFLVTAGNTRERIDDVRDWGNIFTGNTGYSIAKALAGVGEVDLLTSNRQHLAEVSSNPALAPHPVHGHGFGTHAQLKTQLGDLLARQKYDGVFMSAAVSDYRPSRVFAVVARDPLETAGQECWVVQDVQSGKVKSTHASIAVLGERTEKLVDLFRKQWNYQGLLVKFKLEVGLSRDALIAVAEHSRVESGADYVVANTLDMVDGESAGAFLLGDGLVEWVAREDLPVRMVRLVAP